MRCGVHLPAPFVITSVWFFSWVSSYMLRQVTLSDKSLLAAFFFTPKRVSRMTSSMSFQPVWRGELLATPIDYAVVNLLGCCLVMQKETTKVNPLHPNISIDSLHTVLYTFPKELTRRLSLTIKSFFSWWSFPVFSWPKFSIQQWC